MSGSESIGRYSKEPAPNAHLKSFKKTENPADHSLFISFLVLVAHFTVALWCFYGK